MNQRSRRITTSECPILTHSVTNRSQSVASLASEEEDLSQLRRRRTESQIE